MVTFQVKMDSLTSGTVRVIGDFYSPNLYMDSVYILTDVDDDHIYSISTFVNTIPFEYWFKTDAQEEFIDTSLLCGNAYGSRVVDTLFSDTVLPVYYFNSCQIIADTISCEAAFSYAIDSSAKTVYLTNESPVNITSHQWRFSDGTSSFYWNASHPFLYGGYKTVELIVRDSVSGCIDTEKKVIFLSDASVIDCKAQYTYDKTNLQVHFTNTSLGASPSMAYLWDFGDGTTSTDGSLQVDHVYPSAGEYSVCLTMVDSLTNCQSFSCQSIYLPLDASSCQAKFESLVDVSLQQVSFLNLSDATSYEWSFGDGTISTEKSPTHTYLVPGIYLVKLVAEKVGCANLAVQYVNVSDTVISLKAGFGILQDQAKKGSYPTDISGVIFGDASYFDISLGDGTLVTSNLSFSHIYEQAGTYVVCMRVYNRLSKQEDTYCDTLTVGVTAMPSFETSFLQLSPNPFLQKTWLTYEHPIGAPVRLVVRDMLGVQVKEMMFYTSVGMHQQEIDFSGIKRGVYWIEMVVGSKKQVMKAILLGH